MRSKIVMIVLAVAVLVAALFLWRGAEKARIARQARAKKAVSIKILKKTAVPAPVPVIAAKPIVKKFANPVVAIVIDDFGYNKNNLAAIFEAGEPVTLSVLPGLPYSGKIVEAARANGCEAILHLPLEPHRTDVREEHDTIKCGMSEKDITARLDRELASVPGVDGVSNHMGSKATEDRRLMTIVFGELKKRGLYFFDSLTSEKSVCRQAASDIGIPYARRDIFLDNAGDAASIEKEMRALTRFAFSKGSAIAVCHDRKNTASVLARMMPAMAREGIRFVKLSEMVR